MPVPAVLACLGVACLGAIFWPFTVDDAYIVARYAHNLAVGHGYAMNPGVASDGVTGPLWLLPGVSGALLGVPPVLVAKVLGLACALAAVALVVRRVSRRAGGIAAAWFAAASMVAQPSLAGWAVGGLETGAATLALTLCALSVTQRPRPSPVAAGLAGVALAWLRPELAVAVAVLLGWLWRREPRAAAHASAVALFGGLSVCAFRWLAFGHALPLAVLAKAGGVMHGARYTATGVVLTTSVVGVLLVVDAVRFGRRDDRAWALAVGGHLIAVTLAGGDWMPGFRLLAPILPLYCGLLAVASARWLCRGRRLRALLPLALACVLPLVDLVTRVPEVRDAGQRRETRGAELAAWLARSGSVVALVDAGYLAYESGLEVVDLGGLTDAIIAGAPGGHLDKHVPEAYLRARAPDLIVLHSSTPARIEPGGGLAGYRGHPVERRVLAMPWVQARFDAVRTVAYAPGYHYVVLARSGPGSGREAVGEDDKGGAE